MNQPQKSFKTGESINGVPLFGHVVEKPKPVLKIPYHGERASCFVYHPVQNWNTLIAYDEAKREFMRLLNDWYNVVELYSDEMVLSEGVTPKSLKRDIVNCVREIDEERSYYKLEALAESLWDKVDHEEEDWDRKGRKVEQHSIPLMSELEKRSEELRAMDLGLKMARPIAQHEIARRGWAG
jgi:hypothetical protein